jgi:hypothetical protein
VEGSFVSIQSMDRYACGQYCLLPGSSIGRCRFGSNDLRRGAKPNFADLVKSHMSFTADRLAAWK